MASELRRFEVILPMRFPDGGDVPLELIRETRRDFLYQFGPASLEMQVIQRFDAETGAPSDRFLRVWADAAETSENLAFFYKLKPELRERFRQEDLRIVSYRISVY